MLVVSQSSVDCMIKFLLKILLQQNEYNISKYSNDEDGAIRYMLEEVENGK